MRRRYMGGVKKLPYDAEVEYLESTGTQYITLPVSFAVGDYAAVGGELNPGEYTGRKRIVESNPRSEIDIMKYGSLSSVIVFNTGMGRVNETQYMKPPLNVVSSWEVSTTGVTFNGTFSELSRPLTRAVTTITIFCNNGSPTQFMSFYVKNANGKVFDLIPVRVGNIGYMYDKVSGALYGNEGTGAFIVGPDK